MSNTQLISAGDSAASRSAEPGSPLDRVSHDRKAQEGAERALSSESEDEGATSAPELGKTYAFAVKRSLTPVRELPESSPAAPSSPAKSADLQQENAATTSEEAQGEEAHWEIASTRSARRKARKEGSVSGTSSGGSSSEGESDLNSRRRRGASRHVPIYRRVSFNVPTPETVRGQSVRDDLEAVTHPLKSRREHTPSVLVTPDKVLYGNKEQARLKLLSDEVNGHPAPSPARSDWLFEQIAEIASARVRRQREYHESQLPKRKADDEVSPAKSVATALTGNVNAGSSVTSARREPIAYACEETKLAPAAEQIAPEDFATKLSKKDGKRREESPNSHKSRRAPNDSDDPSSSNSSSSSEDEASRRRRKKAEKKAKKLRKLRERETSGNSSEEELAPRRTNNAKVPVPEKYNGVDNRARSLAKWSCEVRTYLLSSNVDPDCLAATGYIAGCLTGRAAEIFSHVIIQAVNERFVAGKGYRKSPWPFSTIVDLLKEQFVSITSVRDAQRQFRELKQWKKNGTYMPVNELAMKLEELGGEKTEVTDWELKRTFLDALDPNIASKTFPMFASDFESREVKFQDVVAEAIVQEQVWMQEMAASEAKRAGSTLSNYEVFSSTGIGARLIKEGKRNSHLPSPLFPPKNHERLSIKGDDVKRAKLLLQTPSFTCYAAKKHARSFDNFRRQRAQPGSKREDFSAVREIEHLRAEKESIYNELLFQRTQVQQANDEIDRLKDLLNEAPSTEAFNIYRTYCRVHMGTSQLRTLDNAGFNTASQAVILSGLVGEGLEIVP